jgi:hypothetical protein
MNIKNYSSSYCHVWVQNLVTHIEVRTQVKSVWEKDAFEDNWDKVGEIKQEAGKKCPKRSFLICTPSQILLVDMQN